MKKKSKTVHASLKENVSSYMRMRRHRKRLRYIVLRGYKIYSLCFYYFESSSRVSCSVEVSFLFSMRTSLCNILTPRFLRYLNGPIRKYDVALHRSVILDAVAVTCSLGRSLLSTFLLYCLPPFVSSSNTFFFIFFFGSAFWGV